MAFSKHATIRGLINVLTLAGCAGGAVAAEPPSRAPAVQSLLDCRAVTDATARLACYDKAASSLDQAERTGEVVTLDRAQRRAVRRQAFGLTLPALSMFDRGEKAEEADRISVTLRGAVRNGSGKWVITLDDGAVWRQIDDGELDTSPRPGATAVIRRASLGSYMMKIDGQSSIRVHRDN